MIVTTEKTNPVGRRPRKRWPYVVGAVVLSLILAAWIALAIGVKHVEPYLKARVISDLSERFDGMVAIGAFHVTVAPILRIKGENLTMRRAGQEAYPPFITIQNFDFATSVWGLFRWPLSIGSAHISGLSITLPPRGQRPKFNLTNKAAHKQAKRTLFVIQRIVCDGARLELLTDKPGKLPLVFEIHMLTLASAGPGRAMPYTATLTEPKPLGEIAAHGEFGPWQTEEPRDTPLSGVYAFMNADLNTIKGIGGTLSSTGNFAGELDEIQVQGQTDTPNFSVDTGGHPMPLHTDFSATVDGTNGDTYLHPVKAKLGQSLIIANGSVVRQKPRGHLITLDVSASNARIEDMLKVAVKTLPPALTGPVNLKAKLVLPPEQRVVAERLRLSGTFELPKAAFTNETARNKVEQLSLRAQGHAKEAKQASEDRMDFEIFSQLQGTFSLKDGLITMPALHFGVPGASINLAGDYRLTDQQFKFQGTARLEAKPSQMTTGFKSFLLKGVDPFFWKKDKGTVVPIEVSGSQAHPTVHLQLRRKSEEAARDQAKNQH